MSRSLKTEEVSTAPAPPLPGDLAPEQARLIKQRVLADVSCVLARANGAEIEQKQAFAAARNICDILFAHPQQPRTQIPKLFWDTPLGRAVGVCCGESPEGDDKREERVRTYLHLPASLRERLRLEAETLGKPLSELVAEKLAR